jgi:predicted patatin/cPLA2 family phospholipase
MNGSHPAKDRRARYRVALVIEGGGSRGMFSAGMCLGLEGLGLESVFDAVYRASGWFIG